MPSHLGKPKFLTASFEPNVGEEHPHLVFTTRYEIANGWDEASNYFISSYSRQYYWEEDGENEYGLIPSSESTVTKIDPTTYGIRFSEEDLAKCLVVMEPDISITSSLTVTIKQVGILSALTTADGEPFIDDLELVDDVVAYSYTAAQITDDHPYPAEIEEIDPPVEITDWDVTYKTFDKHSSGNFAVEIWDSTSLEGTTEIENLHLLTFYIKRGNYADISGLEEIIESYTLQDSLATSESLEPTQEYYKHTAHNGQTSTKKRAPSHKHYILLGPKDRKAIEKLIVLSNKSSNLSLEVITSGVTEENYLFIDNHGRKNSVKTKSPAFSIDEENFAEFRDTCEEETCVSEESQSSPSDTEVSYFVGEKGEIGDKGPQGDQGPEGEQGPQGVPGIVEALGSLGIERINSNDYFAAAFSHPNILNGIYLETHDELPSKPTLVINDAYKDGVDDASRKNRARFAFMLYFDGHWATIDTKVFQNISSHIESD